jgi:hypothetical protein
MNTRHGCLQVADRAFAHRAGIFFEINKGGDDDEDRSRMQAIPRAEFHA